MEETAAAAMEGEAMVGVARAVGLVMLAAAEPRGGSAVEKGVAALEEAGEARALVAKARVAAEETVDLVAGMEEAAEVVSKGEGVALCRVDKVVEMAGAVKGAVLEEETEVEGREEDGVAEKAEEAKVEVWAVVMEVEARVEATVAVEEVEAQGAAGMVEAGNSLQSELAV